MEFTAKIKNWGLKARKEKLRMEIVPANLEWQTREGLPKEVRDC